MNPSDPLDVTQQRHEAVLLFDVTNGNPNGDPDMDNLPRVDPETRQGLVTDVAIKRKIRDYAHNILGEPLFILPNRSLNDRIEDAGAKLDPPIKKSQIENADVREQMIRDYYDVRMFGAVLSTGALNAGQVRGPVQVTFGKSIDPVYLHSLTITRQARTKTNDLNDTGSTEMGRKSIVPYGLYRAHVRYNPFLANFVTKDDLEKLAEALQNLFEFDQSAARGQMAVRGLYVFSHDSKKGCAPAHKLFDKIRVTRKEDVITPRSFHDYDVAVDDDLPQGVTLHRIVQ